MKKLIFLFLIINSSLFAQHTNVFRDSTVFTKALTLVPGASAGKVLKSNATGNATWQSIAGLDTNAVSIDSLPYLPISGGTMDNGSHIYFGTGGQNISQGTFENGTGGNKGISLNCAVGYELNWQGGHLSSSYNNGTTFYPVTVDTALLINGTIQIIDGTQGIGKVLKSNANGLASWEATSFTTSDSATIYALTPANGTTYFCSNCSGDGITGRIVSYFGSLWRRLKFD